MNLKFLPSIIVYFKWGKENKADLCPNKLKVWGDENFFREAEAYFMQRMVECEEGFLCIKKTTLQCEIIKCEISDER